MGAAGEVVTSIGRRNIDLWNTVAANVRRSSYTADDMAGDAARTMTAALDNLRDLWTVLTTPPFGPTQSPPVASRTLFFQPNTSDGQAPLRYVFTGDVPPISLPSDIAAAAPTVRIRVAGPEPRTVAALERSITYEYTGDGQLSLVAQDVPFLTEGLYQGVVYIDPESTPRLVAQLLIAVEPPPEGARGRAGET
jgi:hypothetical protein